MHEEWKRAAECIKGHNIQPLQLVLRFEQVYHKSASQSKFRIWLHIIWRILLENQILKLNCKTESVTESIY